MDTVTIYSIVAGGILVTLTLIRVICSLKSRLNTISMLISKHLAYPYLIKRHRLFGPWTRANVLLYIVYGVVTIFFIAFRVPSASEAARRAGALSLVNMGVTFIATHLSFLADGLGISLKICRRIHRAAGWTAGVLLTLHIILHTPVQRAELSFRNHSNLFGFIFLIFLYRNRIFSSQLSPRALVTCEKDDPSDKDAQVEGKPIKIHVTLPRPLQVMERDQK
ncbi:hypothetical protein I7I51_05880 [Histoplasma capsulatum]|uniref:Ferric oxidoreductase domain-containing protein n=2 Tax=Histoplasma TaxID=5036 RepID=A0A8A1MGH7_AJECA|nr:hypothetical protein I7I51_05880 [Histoplasma capsulatum]